MDKQHNTNQLTESEITQTVDNDKVRFFSASTLTKTAALTALSFILYLLVKFPLPFIFPAFLDIQISELPALLGGFAMGPLVGCVIIIAKCLLKMPFTSTMCVGELGDIILGIAFVLPASIIYKRHKSKKGALLGLLTGLLCSTAASVVVNRFILIPTFVEVMFKKDGWAPLLGMVSTLYPDVTVENFYSYYLTLAVIPFNLIRGVISAGITYAVYKPLSKLLHWEIAHKNIFTSKSDRQTAMIGKNFAHRLRGGETVVLCGQLGAGKTHLTKGIAKGLGIKESVTSPTFAIHNVYYGKKLTLNHFDFYRLNQEEGANLGFEEIIAQKNAISVIEWSQNVPSLLPSHYYKISISVLTDNQRQIIIEEV